MKKEQVFKTFVALGMESDNYGHFTWTNKNGYHLRLVFGARVLRYQVKLGGRWVNRCTGYYGQLKKHGNVLSGFLKGYHLKDRGKACSVDLQAVKESYKGEN